MLFRNILLPTLLIPMISATVALGVLALGFRGAGDRGKGAVATALALLSGYVAMTGWPRFPPVEATQHLFYLVALAAILAWFAGPERKASLRWGARAVLVGLLCGLMLQTPIEYTWTTGQAGMWLSGLFVVGLGLHWAWAESLIEEGEGACWVAAATRLALLSGVAATLGMSGSARLGQLVGALTCGVGVVEVGSRVLGRRPWRGPAALVLTTAVLGLVLAGYFYANLTLLNGVLLLVSCVMLGLPLPGRPWSRLAALLPLALAVGLAVTAMLNRPEDPYADYYAVLVPPSGVASR